MTPSQKKQWLALAVTVPPELVEPLTELFTRHSQAAVAIEEQGGYNPDEGEGPFPGAPVTVRAYLRDTPAGRRRQANIEIGHRLLSMITPIPPLRVETIAEQDWATAYHAHFTLLRLGRRIVVRPPWIAHAPLAGEVVITLDPGLAFGTGHHPTTRLCLEELERLVRPGDAVLDVGCGAGILSIAAAQLGASRILALDIDAAAIQSTRRNARLSGVSRRIRVQRGSLPLSPPQQFDVIAANISAKVICLLAPHLRLALAPRGTLLASGILAERRDEVVQRLRDAGLRIASQRQDGDWVALTARAVAAPPHGPGTHPR